MAEDKYLDPIEETAPEAPEPSPEPVEPTSVAEAQPDAEQPAKRPDTRPEGYVTKGERDRIAGELHQERQARAQAEDRFAKMVERFYKDNAPEQPRGPKEDEWGPDPDVDPVGALKWQREQFKARADAERQWKEQSEKQTQEQREWTETLGRVNARFVKVAAERPEVNDLYKNVRHTVAERYNAAGTPMHLIPDLVTQYEAKVIKWARDEYLPIEDALEQVAAKLGIAPPQRQPAQSRELPPRAENGQFTAEAERAAKIAQSQERNASLGAAPGAPVKKMTAAELAKMPESEMWQHFESIGKKPGSKAFDREMGFRS